MDNVEITKGLDKIEHLLQILMKLNIAQVKDKTIVDETEKKIYEYTGIKSCDEIRKELKVSPNTVSDLWKKWHWLGLLEKDGNSYKKIEI